MAYHGLDTYLNDHLAGATAGVNLAKMAAEEHQTDELGAFFSEISSDIQTDFGTLEHLMDQVGVEKSASKTAMAEIGSKMARPKFVGDDKELGGFITLETLSIGVEGKLCMWKALQRVPDADPAFTDLDFDELIARAVSQRERIEAKRLEIAPEALAHTVNA